MSYERATDYKNMYMPDLHRELAKMQTQFQEQEWKIDRQRALLTGKVLLELGLEANASDTTIVMRTNYEIALDENFAALQQEQLRLAAICREIKAEIAARSS